MAASPRQFFSEVKVELQKASWPWDPKEKGMKKYKELVDSTVIVVVAILLLSGYIALWEFILQSIVSFLSHHAAK
jgi:preprotein translocase subunit SecE